jgi:hypothetical protein
MLTSENWMLPLTEGLVGSDQKHQICKRRKEKQKHHQISKQNKVKGNSIDQPHFLEIATKHLPQHQAAKRISAHNH